MKKIDIDVLDSKLALKNLKRIDSYSNANKSITFHCQKCNYKWKTRVSRALNGNGCPHCNIPTTSEKNNN